MRKILKKIIPRKFVTFVRSIPKFFDTLNYYPRDIKRYLKYSATLVPNKKLPNLEAKVIADAHIIEKGLSLKNPRLGFGKLVIRRLLDELNIYKERNYPQDTFGNKFAKSVLNKYLKFNLENSHDISEFESEIRALDVSGIEEFGGTKSFKKSELLENVKKDFSVLSKHRVSLRQFTGEPVSRDLVLKAVELATSSPSVCNRQSAKVYVADNKEIKNRVVEIQLGNRGFGEQIDKMVVVCSDICSFFGLQERHQSYVDGGLFAMNLLYAFAYYGIGACSLNWCTEKKRDIELRKLLNIKDSENILMIIAIGNLPDSFKTAKSPRRKADDITEFI